MWRSALFGSLGHLIRFWPFWTEFGLILAKIDPDFDLLKSKFQFFMKNHTQGPKPSGKVALFGSLGHLI